MPGASFFVLSAFIIRNVYGQMNRYVRYIKRIEIMITWIFYMLNRRWKGRFVLPPF